MQSTLAIFFLCGISYVSGYGPYRLEIPNGEHVPHPCQPGEKWPGVGHIASTGGGSRNQFGLDFHSSGKQWTEELCKKDSDGDGKTNGEELGDPNCVWKKNDTPTRQGNITHPGVCEPFYSSHCQGKNDWVQCAKKEFKCDALSHSDIQNMTLRFPKTNIPAKETTYKCMIFDVPQDRDYHVVAYKPAIDNDNVMHHIIVYGCEDSTEPRPTDPYDCDMGARHGCQTIIGLWALGGTGNCFNENFGMLFGKNKYKKIAMEYHWNNPKKESNLYDSSGMTFYYTSKLRANNGAVMTVGQTYLEIPPRKPSTTFTSTCPAECTARGLNGTIYVTTAVNHMHYLGKSQSIKLRRKGTMERYITNEPDYGYDNPKTFTFDQPIEILPHDEIITTCTYNSMSSDKFVYYGDATSDEMCFGFLWFYPAEAVQKANCVSYKSVPICFGDQTPTVVQGCNVGDFLGSKIQKVTDLWTKIWTHCHDNQPCNEECRSASREMREHPCMRGGDVTEFIERAFQYSQQGITALKKLDLCPSYPSKGVGVRAGILMMVASFTVLVYNL